MSRRRLGRRAIDPDSPVVDLDRVLADDARIDAITRGSGPHPERRMRPLGARRPPGRSAGRGRDELLDLLEQWRLELTSRPLPAPPPLGPPAVTPAPVSSRPVGSRTTSFRPVRSRPDRSRAARPRAARPRAARSRRPLLAVAAAIGAIVVGSATIGRPTPGRAARCGRSPRSCGPSGRRPPRPRRRPDPPRRGHTPRGTPAGPVRPWRRAGRWPASRTDGRPAPTGAPSNHRCRRRGRPSGPGPRTRPTPGCRLRR